MAVPPRISAILCLAWLTTFISTVTAQTWTDCNPLNRTDCPHNHALSTNYTQNFTTKLNPAIWNITAGSLDYTDEGAEFSIKKRLDSPTIQSNFYLFWGTLEVHLKAASGRGIVSSVVLQSDDRDEIDLEWIGSDTKHVQTNYYGKGHEEIWDRGAFHEVEGGVDIYHNYTVHWTSDKLEWLIDGKEVRTVTPKDANDGTIYPQTPSNVRLGIWPAGDPDNREGTIQWAGGEVDYDAGPYTMTVKQVKVTDFSSGKEYAYGDTSGDWQSIKIIK